MRKFPYKGDWRVKEYKPYTEELEAENRRLQVGWDMAELAVYMKNARIAELQEQLDKQTVCAPTAPPPSPFWEQGSSYMDATRQLWGGINISRWP